MERILLISMMMTFGLAAAQNCPTVDDVNQTFCESEGTGNDFYRPAVQHLAATANGDAIAWYATADSVEPLDMEELLVNGENYFAGNASGTCEARVEVVVTLADSPNAGGTTFYEVSNTAEPFDLIDIYQPSIIGPPNPGGTITPPLASGTTIFDPSVDGSGQYRYEVTSSNEVCDDDFSYIYITVVPEPQDPSQDPSDDPTDDQNCPIVDSTVQVFCESQGTGNDFYRPTVAHLEATANGDDIVWFDTAISTEALSLEEILVDGEDYFAGNASGSCTERVRVEATVNPSPNAGATTFVTFCSEAGPLDLLNYLNPSIIGEADSGGEVVPPFASGTTIFDPSIDLAGRYEYHVDSNGSCDADMAFVYISISNYQSAGNDITLNVSNSDVPFDLFEELGISSDATASVTPALSSGTGIFDPSVDAAGAYSVTVLNDEGCEDDSASVTVNINSQEDEPQNCPIVESANQTFCESEGSGNDFYRPTVAHLQASANGDGVVWFDTELSAEALPSDELLVDGEDYFAGNSSGTCMERQRVLVTVNTSPNAGGTTFYTVKSTDEPFDLLENYEPSILGAPDAGGSFDPPLASGTTIFDPSVDSGGQYRYTVESNGVCDADSSYLYITVEEPTEVTAAVQSDEAVKVSMYPNPSKGKIKLSLKEGVKPISVRIIDINGNTVRNMKLDSQDQLQELDISNLRPALYFAEVLTEEGKFLKRIIKN